MSSHDSVRHKALKLFIAGLWYIQVFFTMLFIGSWAIAEKPDASTLIKVSIALFAYFVYLALASAALLWANKATDKYFAQRMARRSQHDAESSSQGSNSRKLVASCFGLVINIAFLVVVILVIARQIDTPQKAAILAALFFGAPLMAFLVLLVTRQVAKWKDQHATSQDL